MRVSTAPARAPCSMPAVTERTSRDQGPCNADDEGPCQGNLGIFYRAVPHTRGSGFIFLKNVLDRGELECIVSVLLWILFFGKSCVLGSRIQR